MVARSIRTAAVSAAGVEGIAKRNSAEARSGKPAQSFAVGAGPFT